MKKKVLLVDDNLQMLDELTDVFKENNIDLLLSESGTSALEIAEKEPYDVGVIDIRLPDYNGVELVDELKKRQPKAIYLLITAYASTESAIKALHKDVFDYIVKPFSPEELMVSVKKGFLAKDAAEATDRNTEELLKEKSVLQAKVLMLEQMNDIFMDQERKILELKEEINKLLGKLGENLKYTI